MANSDVSADPSKIQANLSKWFNRFCSALIGVELTLLSVFLLAGFFLGFYGLNSLLTGVGVITLIVISTHALDSLLTTLKKKTKQV
jgi:hypothetical protein